MQKQYFIGRANLFFLVLTMITLKIYEKYCKSVLEDQGRARSGDLTVLHNRAPEVHFQGDYFGEDETRSVPMNGCSVFQLFTTVLVVTFNTHFLFIFLSNINVLILND